MTDKPHKTWAFTLNNYTDDDKTTMVNWSAPTFVSKMVVTLEVGEGGTPHFQGAVTFRVAKRLTALKKLHSRIHWEVAACSDAGLYCLKDGSIVLVNVDHREPGKPKNFAKCVELIRNGELKRVRDEYPEEYCRHGRKFKEYNRDVVKPKNMARDVYWYWGKKGTFKTLSATEEAGEDHWMSHGDLQWFDGYDREAHVVIDDIRPGYCKFNYLLRLLDRYKMKVPIKGDMIDWNAQKIWITCPQKPEVLFASNANNDEDHIDQLLRRIKRVCHFHIEGDRYFKDDEDITEWVNEQKAKWVEDARAASPP